MKAAPRDASWYHNPDVYSAKAVHVDNGEEFAMCNAGMLLGGPVWMDAAEVPTHARCRRKACASAYTVADTDREDGNEHA